MMREPESGFLLCGEPGNQQLYERDDDEARANAAARPGFTLEDCWFHVGDEADVYRYEHLLRDYGPENVVHLTVCKQAGCHGEASG